MEERMTINGEGVTAPAGFPVDNPATGEPFAEAPECSAEQLDAAMLAAEAAFPAWAADPAARRGALLAAADALDAAAPEVGRTLTLEQGKPLAQGIREVGVLALGLRHYAGGCELPVEVLRDDDEARVEIRHRPIGPVAAITPWNVPLVMFGLKAAPALAAGNTVVLKPSPYTPLSSLRVGEVLREVLPAGVLNVVSGGDRLGAWMTEHPIPRKITMTGSVATGKRVAAAAAVDLKRVTLELGGNDPALVLDDADPAAVAERLFWAAFYNCGQICTAVKRIYAHERIHDDLVGALAALADKAVVGDGLDEDTQIGPINNEPQLHRVEELVADAVTNGAEVAAGGHRLDRPGWFFAPTVLSGVSDGVRVVDEEQFGPVLPVVSFSDVEEALARANGTTYGLGASVWTSDPERGAALAGRLVAGTSWVNTHTAMGFPHQPLGGVKWSGVGLEGGSWGLLASTETHVVYLARR